MYLTKKLLPTGTENCEWCKGKYRGAWSQHANMCEQNPRKEAK